MLHILQAHHLICQQFERPTLSPIWSLATRQMNQLGFSLAIQTLALGTFSWKTSGEGYLHILLDKPLFDANHGATTDSQRLGNLPRSRAGFALSLVTHQQHAGYQVVFGWSTTHMHHRLQPSALLLT